MVCFGVYNSPDYINLSTLLQFDFQLNMDTPWKMIEIIENNYWHVITGGYMRCSFAVQDAKVLNHTWHSWNISTVHTELSTILVDNFLGIANDQC